MQKLQQMKKIALALIGILCIDQLIGQTTNTFPASGAVGIGTTTPVADYIFHIKSPRAWTRIEATGDHASLELISADNTGGGKPGVYLFRGLANPYGAFIVERGSSPGFTGAQGNDVVLGSTLSVPLKFAANSDIKMTVMPSGNVGIGTIDPLYSLQINGTGASDPLSNISGAIAIRDKRAYNAGFVGGMIKFGGMYTSGNAYTEFAGIRGVKSNTTDGDYDGQLEFFTRGTSANNWTTAQKMVIVSSGNVGIGVAGPNEKLCVNGNIKAKKMIVTQSGWADYVFDENYRLKDLTSVETFIKANKHLPEVPSAKEVGKDGIDLGDTQALLLKKIEELTLYMIALDKENRDLKQRVNRLENK